MTKARNPADDARGEGAPLQEDATRLAMLAAIVESSDDAIVTKNLDGTITTWNRGAEAVFGYTAAEAIGRSVTMLIPPDRTDEEPEILQRIRNGEKVDHYETVRRRKDGRLIEVSLTVSPLRNADGEIVGASKVARDITQSRRVQRELSMLASIVESSDDAIISKDLNGIITTWNRGAQAVFGYTADEAIGQRVTMLMPPERVNEEPGILARIRNGEKVDHYETVRRRKDGTLIDISLTVSPIRDAEGQIIGASKVARDITAQKRIERIVRESEERFFTLAESVPHMVWMANPEGHIFWYNRQWYEYTGTDPAEVEGWGWQSLHDPGLLPTVTENWQASLETGEAFEMEFPLRGADGKFRWFLTRVNPVTGPDGKIIYWCGTNTDIHEQRRVDRRNRFILDLDEKVRAIEDPEEIALELATLLGKHLGVDRCAYAEVEEDEDHFYIPGDYTRDAEIVSIVGHFSMSQFGAEVLRLMRANEPFVVDDVSTDPRVTDEDRASYNLTQIGAVICVPMHKGGRFVSCMAVHQRVPRKWTEDEVGLVAFVANRFWESIERARLIKNLHQAVQREQVARAAAERTNRVKDEFLATVSHELRTPLNAILGWAALLRSEKLSDAAKTKAYETLYNSSRAQAQLIDDLLDVSRIITGKLRLEVQPVEPAGLVESAVESLRPAAEAKGVRLQMIIDPHAGPISGDPARLQQVLWNLLSNAVKYTPKGGRVYVKLEQVNSHIELSVADTGAGIDPAFLPHVFERFAQEGSASFSGRSGLGLGLSISRSLVEMHGGHVKAESQGRGKGATFTVSLPRLPVLPPDPEPAKEKREHPSTSASFISIEAAPDLDGLRVLVVDDEPDARDLVREVLELCGAEVRTCASAAEALEAMLEGDFDLLVSDIGMPETDGYQLIEKVRLLPGAGAIPAVALTAYARVEDRVRALKAGFQTHLPKPIEPIELAAVVASLTGRA